MLWGASKHADARVWVDSEGRTVDAEFVKFEGDVVYLRRNDSGKEIQVPYAKFSDADQQEIDALKERAAPKPEKPAVEDMPDDSTASDSAAKPSGGAVLDAAKEAEARRQLNRNRKWSDEEGNQILAKFVRIYEGNVILLQGNKGHNVDFYKLSADDQSFLRTQMEALGQGNDVPPVVAKNVDNGPGEGAIAGAGGSPGAMSFEGALGASTARSGGSTVKTPPPLNESEQERRIREYQENWANSSLPSTPAPAPTPTPTPMPEPQQIVSNTPAPASMPTESSIPAESSSPEVSSVASYDPWASNQQAAKNEAPPKVTPPRSTPSKPSSSSPKPSNMSTVPDFEDQYVWECQSCHTQFDTDKKPSFCHVCMSIRVGVIVVLSLIGAAVRGFMSG